MLGTEYPHRMGEENPLNLIMQVRKLSKADRQLVTGGNAARLLKIKF